MKNVLMSVMSLCLAISAARADQPGAHPAYLHALTDLRTARAHLEKRKGDPQMKWDEQTAIKEIDAAIGDIKKASIDDGKNLNDHPAVDAKKDRVGLLHRSLELLKSSRKDIKERESNDFANGLQTRALQHIDAAINFVEQGIANK